MRTRLRRATADREREMGEASEEKLGRAKSGVFVVHAPRWKVRVGKREKQKGWGARIVTRELKVLLRSSLSPSNLHWS